MTVLLPLIAVLLLVIANGFFVASEFALVAVRRSRVDELVAEGRANAKALQRALASLDYQIAATQLGITMSSLALGWVGEPAIAHLIEPLFASLPLGLSATVTHIAAVIIAFTLITVLHIVFGELAPKTLALQRPEATSLAVVRPLGLFLTIFRPAIMLLNGLGRAVVRIFGLEPGEADESHLHSPEELKLLVAASQKGGLLEPEQQELLDRVLSIGEREISEVMTPRPDILWIDLKDPPDVNLRRIRDCVHDQLLLGRGSIDELVGVVRKQDLCNVQIDGGAIDLEALAREPFAVHEGASILRVLEEFRRQAVHMAIVVDEYGALEGLVTQTDLLSAIAGQMPAAPGEEAEITERADGSLLIDGAVPVFDAFERLGLKLPSDDDYNTIAGFTLHMLGRIPQAGDTFGYEGYRFEVIDMDGRRIDKLLISREKRG